MLVGLMPVCNNAETLPPVLEAVKRLDPGPDFWIFLDDASTDESAQIIRNSKVPGELLTAPPAPPMPEPYGHISMVREAMLLRSRKYEPDAVVWVDADIEILDPKIIELMDGSDLNVNIAQGIGCGLFAVGHDATMDPQLTFDLMPGQCEDYSYVERARRLGYSVNWTYGAIRHLPGPKRPWTDLEVMSKEVNVGMWNFISNPRVGRLWCF